MNIVVILAGGTGTRLGTDIPKQYIEVEGKPVIGYCLDICFVHPSVDAVQVVADEPYHELILNYINDRNYAENEDRKDSEGGNCNGNGKNSGSNENNQHGSRGKTQKMPAKWRGFSAPGPNRQMSIYHALEDCLRYAAPSDCVMLHDAARPLVSDRCIERCFDEVKLHDGVLPVLPMKDTVYLSEDGKRISSLLEREKIFAGQAPEAFKLGKYYEANRRLLPDRIREIKGSTEPAVLAGMDVAMIDGDEGNFKITTMQDLERFRQKISESNGNR